MATDALGYALLILARKAGELANAAGKAERVGPMVTGAEEAADAARAAGKAEEIGQTSKGAEAVEGCAERACGAAHVQLLATAVTQHVGCGPGCTFQWPLVGFVPSKPSEARTAYCVHFQLLSSEGLGKWMLS